MASGTAGAGSPKAAVVERACERCLAVADAFVWDLGASSSDTYIPIPDSEARALLRSPKTRTLLTEGALELPWCCWSIDEEEDRCTVVVSSIPLMRQADFSDEQRRLLRGFAEALSRDELAQRDRSPRYIAMASLDRALAKARCHALLDEPVRLGEALTLAEELAEQVNLLHMAGVAQEWLEVAGDRGAALRCLEQTREAARLKSPETYEMRGLAQAEWLIAGDHSAASDWLRGAEAAASEMSHWTPLARLQLAMNEDVAATRHCCERARAALQAAAAWGSEEVALDIDAMDLAGLWFLWLGDERRASEALELGERWLQLTTETGVAPYGLRQLGQIWLELGLNDAKGRALIEEYEVLDRWWNA